MWPANPATQSLPTGPLPAVVKRAEEPALLSDDETDCESDRGGDSLSSEDQALLASFIRLQRARQLQTRKLQPAERAVQSAPLAIPARQHAPYAPSCEERWALADAEDDDERCPSCNECSVCWRREMRRFSSDHARLAGASKQQQHSCGDCQETDGDLLFELEM